MRSTARRYLSLHLAARNDHPGTQTDELSREKVDAYRAILSSNPPEMEKGPDGVAQEVLTLLVGGSATTTRVMSRALHHVVSTPHVLGHLRSELGYYAGAGHISRARSPGAATLSRKSLIILYH